MDTPSDIHQKIEKVNSTEPPELPKHFSMLSAQRGKEFDEVAHFKLKELLLQKGYNPTETLGNWGNIESCFMVPHSGSEEDKKFLENLALQRFKQEAILHSSDLTNTLVFADGSSWEGNGLKQWKRFRKYFTEMRSGQRFRLFVSPFKT